jgi:hypothetical protein
MARHGQSKTRLYMVWAAMKRRCYNPRAAFYERYGGRGITVCDRWRESFVAFVEDMGERPPGHEIDRIDNDGNYEPGNCRWATRKEQVLNRAVVKLVTIGATTLPLRTWCDLSGVRYGKAIQRLFAGWAPHHAILCPTLPKMNFFGYKPKELAKEAGVDVATIYRRARMGASLEELRARAAVDGHKVWATRRRNAEARGA